MKSFRLTVNDEVSQQIHLIEVVQQLHIRHVRRADLTSVHQDRPPLGELHVHRKRMLLYNRPDVRRLTDWFCKNIS